MSRMVERLARAEKLLAEREKVLVVMTRDPDALLAVLDGTAKTRAEAIRAWYREHQQEPTVEHLKQMREGGIDWRAKPSMREGGVIWAKKAKHRPSTRRKRAR